MNTKILRLLMVLVLSLLFTQPAYAQGGQPPEYDETVIGANGEIYYLDFFQESGKPNFPDKVLKAHQALAAGGCKSLTNGVNIYNWVGQLVAMYSQKVDWCYNGTTITSVFHTHNNTVYHVFWRYNGLTSHVHSGGVGQTSYRAYSQASFCEFIPPNGSCIQYLYPWVDQTVRGNGTYSGTAGY